MKFASILIFVLLIASCYSLKITCDFYGYDWDNWGERYTCSAKFDGALEKPENVEIMLGEHLENQNDDSVLGVEIHGQKSYALPQGLTEIFPKMTDLYVFRSDLKYISRDAFEGYVQLSTISLSRNHLSSIPYDTFEDLIDLEHFSLSFNQLTSIPNLKTLTKLKSLYLFENSIETLTVNDLSGNKQLEILWIYQNKLTHIDGNILNISPELKVVDFRNNICINKRYEGMFQDKDEFIEYINEKCNNSNINMYERSL